MNPANNFQRLAYFPGCKIPFYMKEYGESFEAVMSCLQIELVKLPFNCCGYPARGEHFEVSVLSAIKNLALAEKQGLDIITPCKCCYGQFKHSLHWYEKNPDLKKGIDALLEKEKISWHGRNNVVHLLPFLYNQYGLENLRNRIAKNLEGKKAVVQYGCHALRPFSVTRFDHPYAPKILEALTETTGIKCLEWDKRTECCGNPVLDLNRELSLKILNAKYDGAKKAGADFIITACTHCQMQYQESSGSDLPNDQRVIPLLFTQLLGAALGLKKSALYLSDKVAEKLLLQDG